MGSRLWMIFLCVPTLVAANSIPRKKFTIDREHLKLDFLNLFGSWSDIFSDAEMDFRYFAAHDQDNNKKLDGLELLTALEHDAKHEAESHDGEIMSTEDLEREVEAIISEHDQDEDGYLNYKEFLTVHKTHPDISGERKHREL